jgi:hypothetical protein
VVSFAPLALPPAGEPMGKSLGEHQTRPGRCPGQNSLLPLPGIEPGFLGCSVHNLLLHRLSYIGSRVVLCLALQFNLTFEINAN